MWAGVIGGRQGERLCQTALIHTWRESERGERSLSSPLPRQKRPLHCCRAQQTDKRWSWPDGERYQTAAGRGLKGRMGATPLTCFLFVVLSETGPVTSSTPGCRCCRITVAPLFQSGICSTITVWNAILISPFCWICTLSILHLIVIWTLYFNFLTIKTFPYTWVFSRQPMQLINIHEILWRGLTNQQCFITIWWVAGHTVCVWHYVAATRWLLIGWRTSVTRQSGSALLFYEQ